MPQITPRDTRVAVVGAGPAGIAVARELAVAGHQVTVFDELPYGGGTMLIGVPAFRLPREAIEMDLKLVERLGVRFRYGVRIGRDIKFEELVEQYDAVAICAGAMNAVALDVPGGDLEGIQYGVDYMKKANLGEPLEVGNDVVIIGGGYTAMDCSRTSLRYGAQNVTIAYRRTRSELVVDEEELGETEREGVRMEFLVSPVEVLGDDNGRVRAVKFVRNRLGEPDATGRRAPVPIEGSDFEIVADTVIPAVSQAADNTFLPVESSFEINRGRCSRGSRHVRHERPRRVCLRRLRDRADDADRGRRARQEVRLRGRSLPVRPARGGRRRQRAHRQLVAPRDARVLRRPAARARAHGAGRGTLALDGPAGQLHHPGRARLQRPAGDHRGHALPDVQLQHLVRRVPLRAVRRLRRCLPGRRHPHDRHQPDEVGGRAAGAGRRLRLVRGRGDGARRGALHPLRSVRQAMPI